MSRQENQHLIDEYLKIKKELLALQDEERDIIAKMDQACGAIDCTTGKFVLLGIEHKAKVERRVNASYPRERNEQHPLEKLLLRFPHVMKDKIRVDYAESGQKIKVLLSTEEDRLDTDEKEIVEILIERRVENPGKPGIEISDLKDSEKEND